MRSLAIAAIAALGVASFASAGTMGNGASQRIAAAAAANTNPVGPFKQDSAGNCRDASGKYALQSYCDAPAKTDCKNGKLCANTCLAGRATARPPTG